MLLGASLVAQMVKNLPAMQETLVQYLGWKDPLGKKWLPIPVFLPGEFHGERSLSGLQSMESESDTTAELAHTQTHTLLDH